MCRRRPRRVVLRFALVHMLLTYSEHLPDSDTAAVVVVDHTRDGDIVLVVGMKPLIVSEERIVVE